MSKTSFTIQLYRDHHWVTAGELPLVATTGRLRHWGLLP